MKIIRAFSRTIQYRPFEPINAFCSAEAEVGDHDTSEEVSKYLDEFCRAEVIKTLEIVRPSFIQRDEKLDKKADKKKGKDLFDEHAEIQIEQ